VVVMGIVCVALMVPGEIDEVTVPVVDRPVVVVVVKKVIIVEVEVQILDVHVVVKIVL
jgi:hypothetical protein